MLKYIGKRLLQLIPVVIGVSFIVFFLLYISPGDPVKIMMGEGVNPQVLEQTRERMGLNDPFFVRFFRYLGDVFLRFDFGASYATKRPVVQEMLDCLPNTLKLTLISMLVSIVGGILFGTIAAIKQNTWIDSGISFVALLGISFPSFWMALMAILLFSVRLGWLPTSGFDTWQSMILPCGVLAVLSTASLVRMTRSSMLDVVRQDYIRTAKAKGLNKPSIIFFHAMRNALIPVVTAIGMDFGYMLGGAVLTETIFSIQGMGRLAVDAIKARDYPVVQGIVLFIALVCCLCNLMVDIVYMIMDPRLRTKKT